MKKTNAFISILGIMLLALSTNTMAGAKSSDAYFVKVDRDTTTQNSEQNDPKKKQAAGNKASGLPTGKRQHKPFVVTKPIDKASPKSAAKAKKIPGAHKSGDITLKRGVID